MNKGRREQGGFSPLKECESAGAFRHGPSPPFHDLKKIQLELCIGARLVGQGFNPDINPLHKFLEINPRGEVAIKSLTHSPFARQIH